MTVLRSLIKQLKLPCSIGLQHWRNSENCCWFCLVCRLPWITQQSTVLPLCHQIRFSLTSVCVSWLTWYELMSSILLNVMWYQIHWQIWIMCWSYQYWKSHQNTFTLQKWIISWLILMWKMLLHSPLWEWKRLIISHISLCFSSLKATSICSYIVTTHYLILKLIKNSVSNL